MSSACPHWQRLLSTCPSLDLKSIRGMYPVFNSFDGWSKGLFVCTAGWCLWNTPPTSVMSHLRYHSVIVLVSLATHSRKLFLSGNLWVSFAAASSVSLTASSFPAIELRGKNLRHSIDVANT